nr:reverse transcriptase domain-containing protein [Tanacetum cinerariifolium]
MMAIFHDMIKKTMEVFMDDFSVLGNSFKTSLSHLEKMLQRCKDTNLCLNWEKSHFMVKEGIVPGHKISKNGIEVDKAKVDVMAKLPSPTTVKDWDLPFELMCDASDFAIGAVLGKTLSDTVLKHDLCELVIVEVRTAITNDGTGCSKPSKERFQKFANNSGVIGGERFRFDLFRQVIDGHEVKHLLGGVVWAIISPDGSIMASLEKVNGFQAVNTPPGELIRKDFEQKGVVP